MKVSVPQTAQTVLSQRSVLTPLLVGLEKPAETGIAMRVTELFSFRRAGLTITTRPIGYQGREGIWVVIIAFGLVGSHPTPIEGAVYTNPRQADEHRLLQQLATQERLPFMFLSPQLKVAVRQEAFWSVQDRQEMRTLLARIEPSPIDKKLKGATDPDFEDVKQELQTLYSPKTLLAAHAQGQVRVSSPFRGVVLD